MDLVSEINAFIHAFIHLLHIAALVKNVNMSVFSIQLCMLFLLCSIPL